MINKIQTYGKQNLLKREYHNFKSYYIVDPRVQELSQFKFYAPGIKRCKLAIGLVLIAVCVITPFTNFFIPGIYKWVVK